MKEQLNYHGTLTFIHRVGGRVVSKSVHNTGTLRMFEAFARAMSGQNVSAFIPKTLDICDSADTSVVKSGVSIPVITTYKEADTDGGNYGVPYCRVSTVLLKNMFSALPAEPLTIKLNSSLVSDNTIAKVDVEGLSDTISSAASGVQLILLWDLYIDNPSQPTGGNK